MSRLPVVARWEERNPAEMWNVDFTYFYAALDELEGRYDTDPVPLAYPMLPSGTIKREHKRPKPVRIPNELELEIIRLCEKHSVNELAAYYELPVWKISYIFTFWTGKRLTEVRPIQRKRERYRKYNDAPFEEIQARYDNGESMLKLAKIYGIGASVLQYRLKRYEGYSPTKFHPNWVNPCEYVFTDEQLAACIQDPPLTWVEIARRLGIDRRAAKRHILKYIDKKGEELGRAADL
jgi:hypothetical protein